MIVKLKERTENADLQWQYSDDENKVSVATENFIFTIKYQFNMDEEVGQFNIAYNNLAKRKEYYFSTNQNYEDYELVRVLFDEAQSSEIDLDDLGLD